ncbi:uncharacterized protein LOC118745412 [Rhagoletis pomonella]|uniref:uncharacterized protein LOC118745412 n=1 Tax=Rhagoletis pomonella TaxID=28610 RepID=UPI00177E864E|nr:uncharacterized protein LOC118745412 [Rhagoletis pomonella]
MLQNALSIVETWSRECGLNAKPAKTVTVLFTRKTKIPPFQLPTLNGVELLLSDEVKYLGVILDRKLTWQRNVEERAKKAITALYSCKTAIGKKLGLKPHIVHWIYTVVVRPILFYGVTVWWTSLDKSLTNSKLTKVQRAACMLITGALLSTPTKAMETLLNFLTVDLSGKLQASYNAVRLNALSKWKDIRFGHTNILTNYPDTFRSPDYTTPPMVLENKFSTRIPSRKDWEDDSVWGLQSNSTAIYTYCSKLNLRVGSGIHLKDLQLDLCFRLPDHCSVFQAELAAVKEAALWLIDSSLNLPSVTIYCDSQAAIKSLDCCKTSSTTALEFRKVLNDLASKSTTQIV